MLPNCLLIFSEVPRSVLCLQGRKNRRNGAFLWFFAYCERRWANFEKSSVRTFIGWILPIICDLSEPLIRGISEVSFLGLAILWEFWELLQSSSSTNLIIEQSHKYELWRCVEWVTYRCNGIFLVLWCFVLGGLLSAIYMCIWTLFVIV